MINQIKKGWQGASDVTRSLCTGLVKLIAFIAGLLFLGELHSVVPPQWEIVADVGLTIIGLVILLIPGRKKP